MPHGRILACTRISQLTHTHDGLVESTWSGRSTSGVGGHVRPPPRVTTGLESPRVCQPLLVSEHPDPHTASSAFTVRAKMRSPAPRQARWPRVVWWPRSADRHSVFPSVGNG